MRIDGEAHVLRRLFDVDVVHTFKKDVSSMKAQSRNDYQSINQLSRSNLKTIMGSLLERAFKVALLAKFVFDLFGEAGNIIRNLF